MKPFSLTPFKTREWALFLAAAATAAALLHYSSRAEVDDPRKPSKKSLEDYFSEHDTNGFKRAGPRGIQFLTHILEYKPLAEKTEALMQRLPFHLDRWIAPPFSLEQAQDRRNNAVAMLCDLGPDAASGVPTVLKVLQDSNSNWYLRGNCLQILGAIGPKAKSAVQTILPLATNGDFEAQIAALALWQIDGNSNIVATAISNRLRFAGADRNNILPYFQSMGPALAVAEPVIEQALFHEDETVRGQAEQILGTIDPNRLRQIIEESNRDASDLLALHIRALKSLNRAERINALQALEVYGPAAASAVPALISRLEPLEIIVANQPPPANNKAGYELQLCIRTLAEIGPAAESATPELVHLLHHAPVRTFFATDAYEDIEVVCRALARIGSGATAAAPALIQLLTNSASLTGNQSPRRYGTDLRKIRSRMRNPVAAVAEFSALAQMAPNDPSVQAVFHLYQTNLLGMEVASAVVTRWRLGLGTNLPLAELADTIEMGTQLNSGRFQSSPRFGSRRPVSKSTKAWRFVSPVELQAAVDLLGDLGPDARPVLSMLEEHLAPTDSVRRKAAIAIRKIDPAEAQRLRLPGLLIVVPH